MVVHPSQIGSRKISHRFYQDVENNAQKISEIELLLFYVFSIGAVDDSCLLYNSSGIMQFLCKNLYVAIAKLH